MSAVTAVVLGTAVVSTCSLAAPTDANTLEPGASDGGLVSNDQHDTSDDATSDRPTADDEATQPQGDSQPESASASEPSGGDQSVSAVYSGRAGKTDFSAHRGGDEGGQPQTIADFRTAVDKGVRDLEFDVRYTADGHPVISHDAKIRCAPKGIQNTKASALRKCKVASLDSLMALAHKNPKVNLRPELKSYAGEKTATKRAQAAKLARSLKKSGLLKRTVIQSFSYRTVTSAIKKVDKGFTVQALEFDPSLATLRDAKAAGVDQYAYEANAGGSVLISRTAERLGITPVAWWLKTESKRDYSALYASGTKTLITDHPQKARQAVEQTQCDPAWSSAARTAKGKKGLAYRGVLKQHGHGQATVLGKGVSSLKYLHGVKVRVGVPDKHKGGKLVLVPAGGDAAHDGATINLTGQKSYTVTTLPGDGGKITIRNTTDKPVEAGMRVVGQQVIGCKAE